MGRMKTSPRLRLLPLPIILKRGPDRLLRQHRAVDLFRWQTAQRIDDFLIGKLLGFFEGAPRYQFGRHARGGDGRAAAEGLEPRIGNANAEDMQPDFHHFAEGRRADFTDAVRVLHLAHIARIEEVVQNELAVSGVHGSVRLSLPKLLAPAGCGNRFRETPGRLPRSWSWPRRRRRPPPSLCGPRTARNSARRPPQRSQMRLLLW